jgi:hypothetical protein
MTYHLLLKVEDDLPGRRLQACAIAETARGGRLQVEGTAEGPAAEHRKRFPAGMHMHVQPVLGHVDAHVDRHFVPWTRSSPQISTAPPEPLAGAPETLLVRVAPCRRSGVQVGPPLSALRWLSFHTAPAVECGLNTAIHQLAEQVIDLAMMLTYN